MIPKELIELEIDFAQRVSELKPTTIEDALLYYTGLYGALFVPTPNKDPKHELWITFLDSLKGKDLKSAVYDFYVKRTKERDRYYEKKVYSGKPCFIYHTEGENAYLHFNNNEGAEPGPLSKSSMPKRIRELKNIFQEIHDKHPEIKNVCGYSWLYNIPAYTRLFPPEFVDSGIKAKDDFGFNIFGQFLDSSENLKMELVQEFLNNINQAITFEQLIDSFRYYPIRTSASIDIFYAFLGIKNY